MTAARVRATDAPAPVRLPVLLELRARTARGISAPGQQASDLSADMRVVEAARNRHDCYRNGPLVVELCEPAALWHKRDFCAAGSGRIP